MSHTPTQVWTWYANQWVWLGSNKACENKWGMGFGPCSSHGWQTLTLGFDCLLDISTLKPHSNLKAQYFKTRHSIFIFILLWSWHQHSCATAIPRASLTALPWNPIASTNPTKSNLLRVFYPDLIVCLLSSRSTLYSFLYLPILLSNSTSVTCKEL